MQCGPKNALFFDHLPKKNGNRKQTSRSFSSLFSFMGSLDNIFSGSCCAVFINS